MKNNGFLKRILALVLSAAIILPLTFTGFKDIKVKASGNDEFETVLSYDYSDKITHAETAVGDSTVSVVDKESAGKSSDSILTMDGLDITYTSPDGTSAKINGVLIGKVNGVTPMANTTYTISFSYRLDDINRPDGNPLNATIYDCRTPIVQVYKNGRDPSNGLPKSTQLAEGMNTTSIGTVNPWNLTKGKWYDISFSFKTDATLTGDNLLSLISYAQIKSSYKNLTITPENGEPKKIDFGMLSLGETTDMNIPTYGAGSADTALKFPALKIVVTGGKPQVPDSSLTLDGLNISYESPDGSNAKINGIVIDKESGITPKPNTTYTVSFSYRLDAINRPDGNPLNDTVYDCRTPIVQVYKNGRDPSNGLPKSTQVATGLTASSAGTVNPWNLTLGAWYNIRFSFKTDSSLSGEKLLTLISYAQSKSTYKNLTIQEGEFDPVKVDFSVLSLPEIANMNTPTYGAGSTDTSLKFPALAVTVDGGAANAAPADQSLKITYGTGGTNPVINILTDYAVKPNTKYEARFEYYIQGNKEQSGDAFAFIRENNSSLTKSVAVKNSEAGAWKDITVVYEKEDISSVTDPNKFFQFTILSPDVTLYIDNFTLTEFKEFDESVIPTTQVIEFDSSYTLNSQIFSIVGESELPSNVESNGTDGYLYADGDKITPHSDPAKKRAELCDINGLEFKSNKTYRISAKYYVSEIYSNDYRCAIGYNATNLGNGEGNKTVKFSHSENSTGWKTLTFTLKTGNVTHGESYIYLAAYQEAQMYFDKVTVEEMVEVGITSSDLSLGEVKGAGAYVAGTSITIKAEPMPGCVFEGWYFEDTLIDSVGAEYSFIATESIAWEARFSGTPEKKATFLQDFEDLESKALMDEVYVIEENSANAHSGNKSLHIYPTLIKGSGSSNRFVPLIENASNNLKENTDYDVYAWVKFVKDNGSRITLSVVNSKESAEIAGTYEDTIIKSFTKPTAEWYNAVEFDGDWMKIKLFTFSSSNVNTETVRFHLSKMNENNAPASIDEFYIDDIEVTESKPFDESTIPNKQVLDFEGNRIGKTEVFCRVEKNDLPDNIASNGSNGYLYADGDKIPTSGNPDKKRAETYDLAGFKFKSNTMYRVCVDYFVAEKYSGDYHCAIGYYANNLGNGNGAVTAKFSHSETATGWKTMTFNIVTGNVKAFEKYIYIASYEGAQMYYDNVTVEEMVQVNVTSADLSRGEVKGSGGYTAGTKVTIKAVPMDGCTFDGWFANGVRVPNIGSEYTFTADKSFSWEARFSGYPIKKSYFIQDFEELTVGPLMENVFEIVEDPANARSGKKSLHVLPTLIEGNGSSNRFVPLLENVSNNLKNDTEYDFYMWVKLVQDNKSRTYFSIVDTFDNPDVPGTYIDTSIKAYYKETKDWFKDEVWGEAVKTDGDWKRIRICTLTLDDISSETIRFHISKMNENDRLPSIDEFYIDDIEIVEREIDYENMKYCDTVMDLYDNGNFEEENVFWTNLPKGLEIVDSEGKEEWQLKKALRYSGLTSGETYEKTVAVKEKYYYTLAAYIKVKQKGDFKLSLTTNIGDNGIRWAAGPKNLAFTADEVGDWKRVSITVETVEGVNALTMRLSGTSGEVLIDNLNLFPAKKGFKEDPVVYKPKTLNVVTVEGDGTVIEAGNNKPAEEKTESKGLIIAVSAVVLVVVLAVGTVLIIKFKKKRGIKNEK